LNLCQKKPPTMTSELYPLFLHFYPHTSVMSQNTKVSNLTVLQSYTGIKLQISAAHNSMLLYRYEHKFEPK